MTNNLNLLNVFNAIKAAVITPTTSFPLSGKLCLQIHKRSGTQAPPPHDWTRPLLLIGYTCVGVRIHF